MLEGIRRTFAHICGGVYLDRLVHDPWDVNIPPHEQGMYPVFKDLATGAYKERDSGWNSQGYRHEGTSTIWCESHELATPRKFTRQEMSCLRWRCEVGPRKSTLQCWLEVETLSKSLAPDNSWELLWVEMQRPSTFGRGARGDDRERLSLIQSVFTLHGGVNPGFIALVKHTVLDEMLRRGRELGGLKPA